MKSREIVRRAIEFQKPPRLPFCQSVVGWAPSDVLEVWEMDRAELLLARGVRFSKVNVRE